MADIIPLSVTSIKIVEPELTATLLNASKHFEAFMTDRNAVDQLAECKNMLTDVVGVLKMLEIPGALLLAQEMLLLLEDIIAQPQKTVDFALSALSQAFVAMPCYLEYVLDREQAIPALTLAFVNEVRSARRQPIIFETAISPYALAKAIDLAGKQPAADNLPSLIKRLRQMYQIGLIGLIRDDNLQLKLQLMHRAMQRLAVASGNMPVRAQWLLTEAVLEALLSGDLQLNFTRKRTLTLVDGLLRQFEQSNAAADMVAEVKLLTELAYLVKLSRCTHSAATEVVQRLALSELAISDQVLQRERHIMQGPNAETVRMMVAALREELALCKEQLEVAAQDNSGSVDFANMAGVFQRTSDILSVIGLTSPSRVLRSMQETVQAWVGQNDCDKEQLLTLADNLLYVESALSKLNRFDLNFQAQHEDEDSKRALMTQSQFSEAESIVIQEAQAGIAQAKKDINSFVESHYDKSHIDSVLESLISVRGGVAILGYKRAAAVLAKCVQFIEARMQEPIDEKQADEILETMADALISLEYYLSEIELHGVAPDNALLIAEQSLAALGFAV